VASGPAAAGPDDGRERVERGDGHGHGSRRLGLGGKTEEETEELGGRGGRGAVLDVYLEKLLDFTTFLLAILFYIIAKSEF